MILGIDKMTKYENYIENYSLERVNTNKNALTQKVGGGGGYISLVSFIYSIYTGIVYPSPNVPISLT